MKKPNELNSIPDRLADDLVGRVADIDKIHELLFKDAQRVAIKGIGGLGKTSVAQAYIRKYRSYFDNIAYIQVILPPNQETLTDSEFTEKIQQGFAYDTVLLKNLGIELDPKTLDVDIYIEICQKLTHHTGEHNLLVIDNTGAILTRFIDHLPKSPDWHILTTSRHDIDNFKTYPLSTLPFEEAETLFKNLYGEAIDDANALKSIFEAVGYLTVAIDLLAKTARSADLSVTDLWVRVQEYSLDFKDAAKVKAGRFNESKTPAEHIIERYVLQELNDLEKSYLLSFAVLPSLPIPFEDIVTWLQIEENNKTEFKDVLNRLDEKGWLLKARNTEGPTFQCHPIIQFAIRAQLKPDVINCAVLIDSFDTLLNVDTAKGEHGIYKKDVMVYGESVFKAVYKKDNIWAIQDSDLSFLANGIGYVYQALGYFIKDLEYRLIYVSISEKILETNDADLATAYNNLALTYGKLSEQGVGQICK